MLTYCISLALKLGVLFLFRDIAGYLLIAYVGIVLIITLLRFPNLRYKLRKVEVRGRKGYLYGFADVGQLIPTIKIGREGDKGSRLASHRTAAPFGLMVFFNIAVKDAHYAERYLHRRYQKFRIRRNNEWFYFVSLEMFFEILLLRFFGA